MNSRFQIDDDGGIEVASEQSILRAADYHRLVEASELIEQARRQAGSLIQHAKDRAEQAGDVVYRRAREAVQAEYAERLARLAADEAALLLRAREKMARLVLRGTRELLQEMDETEWMTRSLHRVGDLIRTQRFITLHVAPASQALAQGFADRLKCALGLEGLVKVEVDEALAAGSCILKTESGSVDASLAVQLAAVRKVVEKVFDVSLEENV